MIPFVPRGDEARGRRFSALKNGEEPRWSHDRRHFFADGTSLQLQLEREPCAFHSAPGHTRAVLFDQSGNEIDATEFLADPPVRIVGTTVPRLRALVDEYLAR